MRINVPPAAQAHFWEEPPPGSVEFWAFRFPPRCSEGERLSFRFDGQEVASAVVSRIERPGQSACAGTGRYGNLWKVFWDPRSFVDRRPGARTNEPAVPPGPAAEPRHADEGSSARHPSVTTEPG